MTVEYYWLCNQYSKYLLTTTGLICEMSTSQMKTCSIISGYCNLLFIMIWSVLCIPREICCPVKSICFLFWQLWYDCFTRIQSVSMFLCRRSSEERYMVNVNISFSVSLSKGLQLSRMRWPSYFLTICVCLHDFLLQSKLKSHWNLIAWYIC